MVGEREKLDDFSSSPSFHKVPCQSELRIS